MDLHMINTFFSIWKMLRFWMNISMMWKLKLPHSLKVSSKLKFINNSVYIVWVYYLPLNIWNIEKTTKSRVTIFVTGCVFLIGIKKKKKNLLAQFPQVSNLFLFSKFSKLFALDQSLTFTIMMIMCWFLK